MDNLFLGVAVYGLFLICLIGIRFNKNPSDTLGKDKSLSVRGIGMYLIVFVHAIPRENVVTFFILVTGIAGVGICFFLSGFGLYKSYIRKGESYWDHFVLSKFSRMLIPYCIIFPINLIITVIRAGDVAVISPERILLEIFTLQMGGSPLWYLKIQLLLYLVFYLCFRFTPKYKILSVTAIVALYMILGNAFGIGRFWYDTSIFFPIGLLVAKYDQQIISRLKQPKNILASTVLCGLMFAILFFWGHVVFPVLIDDIYITAIIAFLIGVSMYFHGNSILRYMGEVSMEIYLVHIFLLTQGCFGLFDSSKGWSYLILLAATLAFSYPLHLICNRLQRKYICICAARNAKRDDLYQK